VPTTFLCPHCEAKLQSANPQIEGKRVRCAKCNSTFTVTAGLIVRDTPARAVADDSSEGSDEPGAKPASPRGKKSKKGTKSSSTAIYWARNIIALVLLIGIVTATVIILINKGWINVGE
jgi:predicted Zn finger-like uncharacterized protein